MVRLKFQRIGKKKEPHFRLIVQEKSKDPYDKSVEILGWFNPRTKAKEFKKDRIEYWLSVGAQPTDSVHNLLITEGLLKADKKKTFSISKKRKAKMEGKKESKVSVEGSENESKPEDKPVAEAKEEAPAGKKEVKIEESKEESQAEEVKEEKKK